MAETRHEMSTTLEIMPDATAELALVVQQNALAPETAASLQGSFAPIYREARSVIEKSRGITVTDASQKLEIKLARECRLALAKIRINGDKLKKSLKEESNRYNKACDGFYNILLHLTADEEARLEQQEKFVERAEAARKAQLSASRQAALAPFGLDTSFMQLGEMPDEVFAALLENTRVGHEAKLARERKEQEDKIRAENERWKEEMRIREENAKLQHEAQEREAARVAEAKRIAEELAERDRKAAEERRAAEELRRKEQEAAEAKLAAERAAAAKAKANAEEIARQLAESSRKEKERIEAENAAKLAEIERQAKAQRDAAEATLRAERERLEAIAAADRAKAAKAAETAAAIQRLTEAGARKERLRLQALADAAEAEREKLVAEAKARDDAIRAEAEKAAEAARKAALAPDRTKLLGVAQALRTLEVPKVSSEAAKDVVAELVPRLIKLASWLEVEGARL